MCAARSQCWPVLAAMVLLVRLGDLDGFRALGAPDRLTWLCVCLAILGSGMNEPEPALLSARGRKRGACRWWARNLAVSLARARAVLLLCSTERCLLGAEG